MQSRQYILIVVIDAVVWNVQINVENAELKVAHNYTRIIFEFIPVNK
jgi:hypothetical protein